MSPPKPATALPAPRAAAIVACGVALASLAPVALHQLGVVAHLPDPPGGLFDSDGITESKAAHPFRVPDGLLGLASYAATMALLLMARSQPRVRPLLATKLAADTGLAGINMVRQIVQLRRICSWCTVTALATAMTAYTARQLLRSAAAAALRNSQ